MISFYIICQLKWMYSSKPNILYVLYCVSRADTESTSEHLEALRKLSSDLEEQRGTLEELRDQRQAVLPRLSLLDKELVKQQVGLSSSTIYCCTLYDEDCISNLN